MKRAAGYFRVSSDAQAREDRNSLDVQRAAFHRHCAERGYNPAGEYQDVMSGRRNARPAYQQLLAAARSGEADVIVVTWLDRFGRNDREIALRVLELEAAGVVVEPTEEDISEFIHMALSAWKAGQESQRIGDRISAANLNAARRGVALGRAPYGYRKAWDYTEDGRKTNHRFELDESRAKWVRWAFEAYTRDNISTRAIARRLTDEAPPKPSGLPWHTAEVRSLLMRRRYTGEWTWRVRKTARRDEELVRIPDAIPAIVSEELFDAAQQRSAVKRTMYAGRTQISFYLLSGLARCGYCGGTMHGFSGKHGGKSGRRYTSYICGNHVKVRTCAELNYQPQHRLENAVLSFIEAEVADVERLVERIGEQSTQAQRDLVANKAAQDAITSKFERNMRLYDSGAIASVDQLATANRLLAEEQQRLTRERDALLTIVDETARRRREAQDLPRQVERLLDEGVPIAERKAIIQSIIACIEVRGHELPRVRLRVLELY